MNTLNTTYPLAPHTIRLGETDRDGHPGRVNVRGAAEDPTKGWGLESVQGSFKSTRLAATLQP